MKLLYSLLWAGWLSLVVQCSADDDSGNVDQADPGKSKEERESKEMEAFMKLMIKSSQKHLKRMIETLDIGSIAGTKCNSSWHQFMAENELSPERFSTIMEDYKSGNHEKIIKLVRPEQCLTNQNGQFCQVDHLTNITMKSKSRVFDVTYALCYPRGCSTEDLNSIMSTITDSYKASMFKVKLNIVKCITSMDNVTKMEIETAQKMMAKIASSSNQTMDFSSFKLPGSTSMFNQPMPSATNLPKFPLNMPQEIPVFSFDPNFSNQFSTSKPPSSYQPILPPPLLQPPPSKSPSSSTSSPLPSTINDPFITKPSTGEAVLEKPAPSPVITPHSAFKWPENEPDETEGANPLHFPEIFYSDETTESKPPTTSSPLDITRYDETQLRKMIPGLILPGEVNTPT